MRDVGELRPPVADALHGVGNLLAHDLAHSQVELVAEPVLRLGPVRRVLISIFLDGPSASGGPLRFRIAEVRHLRSARSPRGGFLAYLVHAPDLLGGLRPLRDPDAAEDE